MSEKKGHRPLPKRMEQLRECDALVSVLIELLARRACRPRQADNPFTDNNNPNVRFALKRKRHGGARS